jgi:hypothetical protein
MIVTDDEAPGWSAIDQALARTYPGQTALHWGTNRLPGQGGIYGLSAYRDDPSGSWFFVTYGLSELFAKETDDPAVSGFGYELTMRVRAPLDASPPDWPRALLDRLGERVFVDLDLGPGHRIDLRQPVTGGNPETSVTALAVVEDPVLGSITTPNGALRFLALVGITDAELSRMQDSTTAEVVDDFRRTNPRLVTDVAASGHEPAG